MMRINATFEVKRTASVLVGTLLYVVGVAYFISPASLLAGGINGIAMLITLAMQQTGLATNLGVLVLVLNIPVIILGVLKISRTFVSYSILSIVVQSVLFIFLSAEQAVFGNDLIANATFGGILIGVGAGICLRSGASLGGMDIVSQFVSLQKQTSIGLINLVTNSVLLGISMFFFEPQIALYTILGFIASNLVVDKLHTGYKRVRLDIISSKGDDVKDELLRSYTHGITIYEGIGAFSGLQKNTLVMITQAHEVYDVRESVLKIDPGAFVTMIPVRHLTGKFNQVIMK